MCLGMSEKEVRAVCWLQVLSPGYSTAPAEAAAASATEPTAPAMVTPALQQAQEATAEHSAEEELPQQQQVRQGPMTCQICAVVLLC